MEEEKEVNPLSIEEFKSYIGNIILKNKINELTSKFKSVTRAIKRGLIINGHIKSNRPFNNRANTSNRKGIHSRKLNELKKRQYKQYGRNR